MVASRIKGLSRRVIRKVLSISLIKLLTTLLTKSPAPPIGPGHAASGTVLEVCSGF